MCTPLRTELHRVCLIYIYIYNFVLFIYFLNIVLSVSHVMAHVLFKNIWRAEHAMLRLLGAVWYVCLKTENCSLKIFMEIRVSEKVCQNV